MLNVLTVVTSQGPNKVDDYQLVSKKLIKSQILNIFNQFQVDAIKIGLLTDIEVAKLIRVLLL